MKWSNKWPDQLNASSHEITWNIKLLPLDRVQPGLTVYSLPSPSLCWVSDRVAHWIDHSRPSGKNGKSREKAGIKQSLLIKFPSENTSEKLPLDPDQGKFRLFHLRFITRCEDWVLFSAVKRPARRPRPYDVRQCWSGFKMSRCLFVYWPEGVRTLFTSHPSSLTSGGLWSFSAACEVLSLLLGSFNGWIHILKIKFCWLLTLWIKPFFRWNVNFPSSCMSVCVELRWRWWHSPAFPQHI